MKGFSSRLASVGSSVPDNFVTAPPRRQSVVLLVDDDPDSLLLMQCILEAFDCSFVCETDGQQALQVAQQIQPSLILLDIVLPGLNGIELTKQLRSQPKTQITPIIAVTALAHPTEQREILAAGCTQCVSKPYMVQDMEALLRQYLTRVS